MNKFKFAIPAWLDMTEKVFRNIALIMIAASIIQMLRTSVFVFCAFMASFFLNRKLFIHHYSAIATIVIGTIIVGLSYLTREENKSTTYSSGDIAFAIILI